MHRIPWACPRLSFIFKSCMPFKYYEFQTLSHSQAWLAESFPHNVCILHSYMFDFLFLCYVLYIFLTFLSFVFLYFLLPYSLPYLLPICFFAYYILLYAFLLSTSMNFIEQK